MVLKFEFQCVTDTRLFCHFLNHAVIFYLKELFSTKKSPEASAVGVVEWSGLEEWSEVSS
jgi:hypothetical protein